MQTIKTGEQLAASKTGSGFRLKIPPPIYMFMIAGMMWLLDVYLPLAEWIIDPWNKLGWGLMILSLLIALAAFRLFAMFKTTVNPHHPENASSLVTHGVYGFSRNPMYLSLLILLIGWSVYLGSFGASLVVPLFIWIVTVFQIKPEEYVLEKIFGEEYLNYKNNVRRWL